MFTDEICTHLIADSYYEAALAKADMRNAAEMLELIRVSFVSETDHFEIWDTIDHHVGQSNDAQLQKVLMRLRERFEQQLRDAEIARLNEALRRDAEAGWIEWLSTYARTLSHWRPLLCLALCEAPLSFPEHRKQDVKRIKESTWYIASDQGADGYEVLIYLAEQETVPNVLRARLYVYAADYQLYTFVLPSEAKNLLERAEELAPEESLVQRGWGAYWLQQDNVEKAKSCLQEALKKKPLLIEAYLTMGDCHQRLNDFDAAEQWYREAIKVHSGYSFEYISLLRLYGHSEWFATHEEQLQPLLERAICVDPDYAYSYYLNMGSVYQQNQKYKQAYDWYNKAVELDERRLNGYISIGYAALEENNYKVAENAFRRGIEVAPKSFDGYWGMGLLYEQQEQWLEALGYFEQSLLYRPQWKATIHGKIGDIKLRLKRYEEAEQELTLALRYEPDNEGVLNSLENLAIEQESGNPATARHIYDAILQIKGQSYEASYYNRIGMMHHSAGEYQPAIESYQKAIALEHDNIDYLSNLAYAWVYRRTPGQRLVELENALAALHTVLGLNPRDNEYAERAEQLERERRLVLTCGERTLKFLPEIPLLSLGVSTDLTYVLTNGQQTIEPKFDALYSALGDRFQQNFGVDIDVINLDEIPDAPSGGVEIRFSGVPISKGIISLDERFFPGSLEELEAVQVEGRESYDPLTREKGYWIKQSDWATVKEHGLYLWHIMEYPLKMLERFLLDNMVELIHHQWVMNRVTRKGESSGMQTYEDIKNSPEAVTALTQVLKRLVAERVPIKAFDQICEQFIELLKNKMDLRTIVEQLRSLPEILPTLPGNDGQYTFYRLGPFFESELAQAILVENAQPVLVMEHDLFQFLAEELRQILAFQEHVAFFVEQAELRSFVRQLMVEFNFPDIPVLSRRELLPGLEEKEIGKIELTLEGQVQETAITQKLSRITRELPEGDEQ